MKEPLDTVQMALNGHVLYTKKDFYGSYSENSLVDLVANKGHYICKDCLEADINLVNKICPNKGVGEIKVVKPVFVFHLTDGKSMAVVGEKITFEKEYIVVWEGEKMHHLFKRERVNYVMKDGTPQMYMTGAKYE